MQFNESDEFKRDFKKLKKKYKTLEKDFSVLKQAIEVEPAGDGTIHWNILFREEEKYILKMRMMCRAVKGSSFRVTYLYDGEKVEVLFIEMYFKGDKEREDKTRIEEIKKRLK